MSESKNVVPRKNRPYARFVGWYQIEFRIGSSVTLYKLPDGLLRLGSNAMSYFVRLPVTPCKK